MISFNEFIHAAINGDLTTVHHFITQNCHRPDAINGVSQQGFNALYYAILHDNTAIVNRLIQAKADINHHYQATDETPLMLAAKLGRYQIIRELIDAGADINARNKNRMTPLIIATIHGKPFSVIALLTYQKIDLHAVDNQGRTALDITFLNNFTNIRYFIDQRIHSTTASAFKPFVHNTKKPTNPCIESDSSSTAYPLSTDSRAPNFEDRLIHAPDFDESSIPPELINPISHGIINQPTTTHTNVTYDRRSLLDYFAYKGNPELIKCPVTGGTIRLEELNDASQVIPSRELDAFVRRQEMPVMLRTSTETIEPIIKRRKIKLKLFDASELTFEEVNKSHIRLLSSQGKRCHE